MHRISTSLCAFSLLSSLAVLGCTDDPPTPTELRGNISSDLGNVLREANAAFTGSTDALPGSVPLAMVDRALGANPGLGLGLRAMTAQLVAPRTGAGPADGTAAIDTDAQIAYLNDKLFTDANHVGDGIYQVPASLVCARTTFDPTGQPIETVDAKCAEQLAKADLRIRTAKDGGALVFAIQLDADHDEPLRLTLTHTSIALTADLDGAQRAFVALATVFGQDVPNAALSGQLTGKLEILGTAKAKAQITIDRALSIKFAKAGADLAGAEAFVVSSAAAEAFSVTLDGAQKSGTLAVGLGETAVKIPALDPGKRFELDLPGATATASLTAGQPLEVGQLDDDLDQRRARTDDRPQPAGRPRVRSDGEPRPGDRHRHVRGHPEARPPDVRRPRRARRRSAGLRRHARAARRQPAQHRHDRSGRGVDRLAHDRDEPDELRLRRSRRAVRHGHRRDRSEHRRVVHAVDGRGLPLRR